MARETAEANQRIYSNPQTFFSGGSEEVRAALQRATGPDAYANISGTFIGSSNHTVASSSDAAVPKQKKAATPPAKASR